MRFKPRVNVKQFPNGKPIQNTHIHTLSAAYKKCFPGSSSISKSKMMNYLVIDFEYLPGSEPSTVKDYENGFPEKDSLKQRCKMEPSMTHV